MIRVEYFKVLSDIIFLDILVEIFNRLVLIGIFFYIWVEAEVRFFYKNG